MDYLILLGGLTVLVAGAEIFVRGASELARAMGVSAVIVGLTVVAFGTSAPEISVGVISGMAGKVDLSYGNIVGSNIFNVCLVLGLAAFLSPVRVSSQLVKLDVPVLIFATLITVFLGWDGSLDATDGCVLVTIATLYTALLIGMARKQRRAAKENGNQGSIKESMGSFGFLIVGILMLVLGSKWTVDAGVAIATSFGMSEFVIGVTVIAIGTSLPEVATTVAAALKKESDLAAANVVGSNILNLLLALGVVAIVAPGGIPINPQVYHLDLPLMVGLSLVLLPLFWFFGGIGRKGGVVFLIIAVSYLTYTLTTATGAI